MKRGWMVRGSGFTDGAGVRAASSIPARKPCSGADRAGATADARIATTHSSDLVHTARVAPERGRDTPAYAAGSRLSVASQLRTSQLRCLGSSRSALTPSERARSSRPGSACSASRSRMK